MHPDYRMLCRCSIHWFVDRICVFVCLCVLIWLPYVFEHLCLPISIESNHNNQQHVFEHGQRQNHIQLTTSVRRMFVCVRSNAGYIPYRPFEGPVGMTREATDDKRSNRWQDEQQTTNPTHFLVWCFEALVWPFWAMQVPIGRFSMRSSDLDRSWCSKVQ